MDTIGPLEFTECLVDSPFFRSKLHIHEKELEKTSQQIKQLIKEVKDLLNAAKNLSLAQRKLSRSLENFSFSSVTTPQTDDERMIQESLKEFGSLIAKIEDVRDKILQASQEQIIMPLEKFRKENIGGVKEGKKKFEKQTAKFCQSQERYLSLSTKKLDSQIKEADATLDMEERELCQASMQYVFRLQEVEELKKFEFVETLLSFLLNWFAFYHQGHDVYEEFKPYMTELQLKIQKTRENFDATRDQAESLMKKMLELRQQKALDPTICKSDNYTREGYLFLMEKKAFGTTWTKHYCMYKKDTKEFEMYPFNQITSKTVNGCDKFKLASCTRRMSDTIEKRFCFDLVPADRPNVVLTLQALSEKDRNNWMDVMDGIEPTYAAPGNMNKEERQLDEVGFQFVSRCVETLELRGLEEQGLYRVVGVSSKVNKLLVMGLDRRKADKLSLDDPYEWESKTITSALKTYLRLLPEPLMTFRFHEDFIEAAKRPTSALRVAAVHVLVRQLPKENLRMLDILIKHLTNVAAKADKNLMSISNLGVCFGPSLLRPAEETVAAILNIKFCNIVVEIMIENYEKIFRTDPDPQELAEPQCYYQQTNHRHVTKPPHHSQQQQQQSIYGSTVHVGAGPPRGLASPGPPMRAPPRHHYSLQHPVTHAVTKTFYSDAPSSVMMNSSPNSAPSSARDREFLNRLEPGGSERETYWREPGQPATETQNTHHMPYDLAKRLAERHEGLNSTSSSNDSMSSYGQDGTEYIARASYARTESPDLLARASYARTSSPDVYESAPPPRTGYPRTGSPDLQYPPTKDSRANLGIHPPPAYRPSVDSVVPFSYTADASSLRGQAEPDSAGVRRVRTLYACMGENDGELSFDPNQIITNVRPSLEPGWLEGTLNGKTGLIPENYVEVLP